MKAHDPGSLPPNVYLRSYLEKAGVRFDVNIVDTECRRGLSVPLLAAVALPVCLSLLRSSGIIELSPRYCYLIMTVCCAYILLYAVRYQFFLAKRRTLRRDTLSLAVEAYAVVVLDGGGRFSGRRWVVLFKECGSRRPRFFTSAVRRGAPGELRKDQLARVFIDHRRPRYYSVDDDSGYRAVPSSARRWFWRFSFSGRAALADEKGRRKTAAGEARAD